METTPQAQQVADYLVRHPNFFNDHPTLLADLYIPHPHGTHAVSMSERQLIALRDKVRTLETKLAELIRFGEENDAISEKLHALTLALMAARCADDIVAALNLHLYEGFAVPHYALRVWNLGQSDLAIAQPVDDAVRKAVQGMAFPVCGMPALPEALAWFGEIAPHLRSFATIPLTHHDCVGVLVLASEEPDRFYASMGTLYLSRLAQLLAAAMQRIAP